MSKILDEIQTLLDNINKDGIVINGTKELQNVVLKFNPNNMNMKEEEIEVKNYYGEDFEDRKALEATHYKRLFNDMIHEITRTLYFTNVDKKLAIDKFIKEFNIDIKPEELKKFKSTFNLEDFSGRRNVIYSLDCISSIQLLCRPDKNILTAIIRSSDTKNLLPIDLLFLNNMMSTVLSYYGIKKNKEDELFVLIVSSHIYDKDLR